MSNNKKTFYVIQPTDNLGLKDPRLKGAESHHGIAVVNLKPGSLKLMISDSYAN